MGDEKKEKKSWKSLFINEEGVDNTEVKETKKVETKKESTNLKFPDMSENSSKSEESFGFGKTVTPAQTGQVSQEHFEKFVEVYEKKFSDLNQDGYDFFEFFQSIIHGDVENPQTYKMAFGMGSAMDKSISKEKLLSQSEFYIEELNNVYNKYVSEGTAKKKDLTNQKQSEAQNLTNEVNSLKEQFEAIKFQIQDKEKKLSLIDGKYEPQIVEVDKKLLANDCAKNKILTTIEKVKEGIQNNLK